MQSGWGLHLQAYVRQVVPRDGCPLPDVTSVTVVQPGCFGASQVMAGLILFWEVRLNPSPYPLLPASSIRASMVRTSDLRGLRWLFSQARKLTKTNNLVLQKAISNTLEVWLHTLFSTLTA